MPAAPATYMLATVAPIVGPQGQLQMTPVGQFGDLEAVLLHVKQHNLVSYIVYQNLPVLAVGLPNPAVDLASLKAQSLNAN